MWRERRTVRRDGSIDNREGRRSFNNREGSVGGRGSIDDREGRRSVNGREGSIGGREALPSQSPLEQAQSELDKLSDAVKKLKTEEEAAVEASTKASLNGQRIELQKNLALRRAEVWFRAWVDEQLAGLTLPADFRFDIRSGERFPSGYKTGNFVIYVDFYRGPGLPATAELIPNPELDLGGLSEDRQYNEGMQIDDRSLRVFTRDGLLNELNKKQGMVYNWMLDIKAELKKK